MKIKVWSGNMRCGRLIGSWNFHPTRRDHAFGLGAFVVFNRPDPRLQIILGPFTVILLFRRVEEKGFFQFDMPQGGWQETDGAAQTTRGCRLMSTPQRRHHLFLLQVRCHLFLALFIIQLLAFDGATYLVCWAIAALRRMAGTLDNHRSRHIFLPKYTAHYYMVVFNKAVMFGVNLFKPKSSPGYAAAQRFLNGAGGMVGHDEARQRQFYTRRTGSDLDICPDPGVVPGGQPCAAIPELNSKTECGTTALNPRAPNSAVLFVTAMPTSTGGCRGLV